MKKFLLLMAAAATLVASAPALRAHSDDALDAQKTPHGGQLRAAGNYHYELVVSKTGGDATDSPVVVHVTDHAGAKVPTAGARGTATILVGKNKSTAALAPDGDNRLKGTARYQSTPGMVVVVSITLQGKAAEQARFTPLAASKPAPAGHQH